MGKHGRRALSGLVVAAALAATTAPAAAQWARVHEQFYMPAEHNWVFRRNYPQADRLFNAFDYGHAILYEILYTKPDAPVSKLEDDEYGFVTRRLLVSPPRVPLEEGAIEIAYAKLAPEAKAMFEWAHILHRQVYDVLGDERLSREQKDAEVEALVRYYKSRPELAFSSLPKNMELMEGQHYSTAFRDRFPKFNGLIWGYHWLQVGLYEPLLTGRTVDERQAGVTAAVTRFRQMLIDAPENMPRVMPMTAAIAPAFAERYPEAAIIFDNLHGMHDVISDILASPRVPREKKREEILAAARRYRDDTSYLMTRDEWRQMSLAMGAHNMGGPVTGFLAGFPEPTLPRGAVMAHGGMDHGSMGHGGHGTAMPSHAGQGAIGAAPGHAGHGQSAAAPTHAEHGAALDAHGRGRGGAAAVPAPALSFVARLLADPEVEARVHADPALHRLWSEAAEDAAGHARMALGAALVRDPVVQRRIERDPALRGAWADPAVRRAIEQH